MGNLRAWEVGYEWDQMKAAQREQARRLDELSACGVSDPMTDLEYVKLRLRESVARNEWLQAHSLQIAYARRDRTVRELGKQYGIASRTIRELRGEIALLREKIRESR